MEITNKLLAEGLSDRGGYSKQQVALLGLAWPLKKGWKRAILGKMINESDAKEFIRLSNHHLIGIAYSAETKSESRPVNWGGATEPVEIYLYVLSLEKGRFYVGLTSDIDRRFKEHCEGEKGAEWTKLYPPISLVHSINTGTKNAHEAEKMEDEVTVTLMLRYGVDRVRGGHFCSPAVENVEISLRGHHFWDRIRRDKLDRTPVNTEASWGEALDGFLDSALNYYDAGSPNGMEETVFSACYKLTRYHYWDEEYAPALNQSFWSKKGVLPVLLSFKYNRPIASGVTCTFEVLNNAMNRGRKNGYPLRRLFLLAWLTYLQPETEKQLEAVNKFKGYINDHYQPDTQYDTFISILLPEMRHVLRSA